MNRITVKIDGMHCPECEAHVNDLFRKNLDRTIKVSSSTRKKEAVILTDKDMNDEEITKALDGSGYKVLGINHKNGLKDTFGFKMALKFYHPASR